MDDDIELLRRYVAGQSEAAFTELVRRHIGLVRATALRRVWGDAHLADDVTQAAFISLARKASALLDHRSLAGWLFTATQLAAAEIVRAEQRRKVRETTAHTMDIDHASDLRPIDLAHLRRLLDDALIALNDDDREAILMRFFQQRSFAEIGAVFQISEDAARKRVDRSLEKLHIWLSGRGITSAPAALTAALAAVGVCVVPEFLITKVSAAAMVQSATGVAAVTAAGVAATLLPLAAATALALGTMALTTQRDANEALAGDIARLQRQSEGIFNLRAENERIRKAIARTKARPAKAAAVVPVLQVTPPTASSTRPADNLVTVSPEGYVLWDGQAVRLEECIAKLVELDRAKRADGSKVFVHANGARFLQMTWVLEEARKAGITNIVVESDAVPPSYAKWTWF